MPPRKTQCGGCGANKTIERKSINLGSHCSPNRPSNSIGAGRPTDRDRATGCKEKKLF